MQSYRFITDIDSEFMPSARANVITLKEFSANVLVSRGVLFPTICCKLPQRFVKLLMQCAIKYSCRNSISSLLDAWRHEVFSIEIPVCMKRWESFLWQNVPLLSFKLVKEQCFVSFIIEHVIDSLTSDCENECKLRCLDFSSIPVKGSVLHSICKLLIEKFAVFLQCENDSHAKKRTCSKEQNSLNKFVIKINVVVNIREDFSLLSKTLSHLKDNNTALKLQITTIRLIGGMYSMDISRLLDLIEPGTLDTFSCCLIFFPDDIPYDFELIQKLRNFPNLRTLNFELIVHNVVSHGRLCLELNDLFHHLQFLKHVYINNFDKPIQISQFQDQSFASKISLESLALKGFKISANDLKNSSLFSQAHALKTLNLANTEVDLLSLVCLLTSCKNLLDLGLSGCTFLGGNIDLLFQALPGMKELEYLSIKGMKMNLVDLMSKAGYISRMPSLKYLTISPAGLERSFRHAVEILWNSPSRKLRCG